MAVFNDQIAVRNDGAIPPPAQVPGADVEALFDRYAWLMPLALAILTVVFLKQVVFPAPGEALDGKDFRDMFYPLHEYIRQVVQSGQFPLWNPRQFIGHPLIGNPHSALFYPATWFMWLVGVQRGMNLMLVLHSWLGAWGMARLMRNFGASHLGALLSGVVYAMSGWAGARYYVGHYNLMIVVGWIPWAMLAYRHALARGTWRSLLPGLAVIGGTLLAGHPPMVLYAGVCLVTLWVYHVARHDDDLPGMVRAAWSAGWRLTVIVVGGLLLGAALVLPAAELTSVSNRTGSDLTFANAFALPPGQILSELIPGLFGNPKVPPYYYWGADFFEEYMAYAGLIPLLAIPLALRWKRIGGQHRWYWIGVIAFALVMSVGLDGALLPLFVRWIPGFAQFRAPGRWLFFVMLGMAALIGLFVTALQNSSADERREMLCPVLRLWIPGLIVTLLVGSVYFSGWYASASHVEPMPLRAFLVGGALAETAMILAAVWLALWLWTEDDSKTVRRALALTVLIVILDAWHVAIPISTVSSVPVEPLWAGAAINVPIGADARVMQIAPYTANENDASITGYLNIDGYDPLPVETFTKMRDLSGGDPTSPLNTLLGVKYVLSSKPYDKPNFKLIGITGEDDYYQRTDAAPRTWFAKTIAVEPNDDAVRQNLISAKGSPTDTVYLDHAIACTGAANNGGTAAITAYGQSAIEIKTDGAGWLTLSDQYYPGWQASVDGQAVPIVRADTTFRAVCVPAGSHTVRFDYRPNSLVIGVAISAVSWISLLILSVISMIYSRRLPRLKELNKGSVQ